MAYIKTAGELTEFRDHFWKDKSSPLLFGIGRQVLTPSGTVASARFAHVNGFGENLAVAALLMTVLNIKAEGAQTAMLSRDAISEVLKNLEMYKDDHTKPHFNLRALERAKEAVRAHGDMIVSFVFENIPPVGVEETTLRLHALSLCLVEPRQLNLKGIFGVLPNVVWNGGVPLDEEDVDRALMNAVFNGQPFSPESVDRIPHYASFINAKKMGVRMWDARAARLGAHLGNGTSLMHGACVNFDAGTEADSMLEGLVASQGKVARGTDFGHGSRIIGVLSGGNDIPVSVGPNCLLEMGSQLGISLGPACIVAAGVSVMGSSLVIVRMEGHKLYGEVIKASELAGISAATFRRNDKDGLLEMVRVPRNEDFAKKLADGETILNKDLHMN